MSAPKVDFLGTSRFELRRRLGSGGMGVVYEAFDRERQRVVALKTLIHAEASNLFRFKREFRSLADVSHPNLVSLYELMSDGNYWFFTMELIEGTDFLSYVREPVQPVGENLFSESPTLRVSQTDFRKSPKEMRELDSSISDSGEHMNATTGAVSHLPSLTSLNLSRLRSTLKQLVEGVFALHQSKMLHRDIKPSNILVTKEGRVVLLDFGLVTDTVAQFLQQDIAMAGTPAYMSPEQVARLPVTEASDWYNVGVVLYEALTGRLPFTGNIFEVFERKRNEDPPAPRQLAPSLPADLDQLCQDLLRHEPQKRPQGLEVLRRLEGAAQKKKSPPPLPTQDELFIGRERFMRTLHDAFQLSKQHQTVTVYLHGSSGIGKSTLTRRFIKELQMREQDSFVILGGRCYERESVPYKALDGVVDSLSKYLMSLDQTEAEALMPHDVNALSRLFPVMLQVRSIARSPFQEQVIPDPLALRRRAFKALRELLTRIAERHSLIIFIEDLHWADADSTMLLADLLRPPAAPPLLLIASFRSEEIESKSFLRALLKEANSVTRRELTVGSLPLEDARQLARSLLPQDLPNASTIIETIVREAGGSPFFVEQLAGYALASREAAPTGITLAQMLDERLDQLPAGARQLLETLAVAGRPVPPLVAFQASKLEGDEAPLIASLRAARLLRMGGTNQGIELYHDRLRETLYSLLEPEHVRLIHRSLAETLSIRGLDDPEALYQHLRGAGETELAEIQAVRAAKKATSALAFDRAALFYRRALKLAPPDIASTFTLKAALAESLANAGRTLDAARAFQEAADAAATFGDALDLRRRAAEQLLMGGHIGEGLAVIRRVLNAVGFNLPRPKRALLSLLIGRTQLWFRGLGFVEREANELAPLALSRIDICWAVAAGLGMVDLIRAADFQTRNLLLSLRAGEPYRIARALAAEVGFTATGGGPKRERAAHLAQVAHTLSERVGHPHAIGLAKAAKGLAAYLTGEWREAFEECESAVKILRDECTGVTWELTSTQRFLLSSLMYLGEVAEISSRVPSLLNAAKEQGNLYAATDLRTRLNLVWLAVDDPDQARQEVIEALQAWSQEGFHFQHFSSLHALTQIELYTGDGLIAWKHLNGQWRDIESSMLWRVQALRIEALFLRGRTALAAALNSQNSAAAARQYLRTAEQSAARIEKEKMRWAAPLALLIRAGIASFRQQTTRSATMLYATAEKTLEDADMWLHAAAARRRRGQFSTGTLSRKLIAEADEWMTQQRIIRPDRIMQMLAPAFDEQSHRL